MNERRVKELIKGHLEEIASSLEFNASKEADEIDTRWLSELKNRLGKVIQAIDRYQEEELHQALEIAESIEW